MTPTPPAKAAAPQQATTNLTVELADAAILIIDNEPEMRRILTKLLCSSFGRLDVAEGTVEGTALLDEVSYHVIVFDNIMSHGTGVAMWRWVDRFDDLLGVGGQAL